MRKVLSLVLILSLVLGSFGFVFAAPSDGMLSDVAGTEYDEAVTVLYALDVVSGYENTGLYQPEQVVTRAEMAVLIIRELGLASNAEGNTSSFPDMDGYGWAEGYIGYAQQLKIIAGYPDGTFKPGNTVTYDEALTMIVSAIGYTQSAREMQGDWPAVYVAKARQLDITDNVTASGSAGAKRGDIAIYLYNALTCTTGYVDGNGNFKPNTDKDLNEILMINNLGAEQSKSYSIIDGTEDALINIKPYVGQSAKTIYMTKGKYEDYIIAIGEVQSEEITGVYDPVDKVLEGIDGVEYKLDNVIDDTQGKNSSKVKEAVKQFKNGDLLKASQDIPFGSQTLVVGDGLNVSSAVKDEEIQVTMHVDKSSRTVNGIYSILFWTVDQHGIIEADDLKDITSDQSLFGEDFTLTDDDEIDEQSFQIYGANTLDDIKAGDVVYVYVNDDDEIARIDVGTETVEGEATRVNNSGEKVTISGTIYEYSENRLANNGAPGEIGSGDIEAGDEVALILDAFGYIYDRDYVSSSAGNYGVVIGVGSTSGASTSQQIRLVLADGSDKTFDVADKLFKAGDIVTGVTNTGVDNTTGFTGDKSGWDVSAGQVVKYSLDKNGKISNFEYIGTSTSDSYFTKTTTDNPAKNKVSKSGTYNGYTIADGAVVWTEDGSDLTDPDNYRSTTRARILDSDPVNAQYVVNKNKIVAIVLYDFSSGDEVFGIAVDRGTNGSDAGYEIEFWVDGKKDFYNATSDPYSSVRGKLTPSDYFYNGAVLDAEGPLWRLKMDADGDVTGIEAAVDYSKVTFKAYEITNTTDAKYNNRRFEISNGTPLSTSKNTGTANDAFTIHSSATIYMDDKDGYKTVNANELGKLSAGTVVYFYDTVDEDEVMDVVVIIRDQY